jgi:hypothetical protein
MARTISEIYDSIIIEKQTMSELNALQPAIDSSQTLLDDLTSSSKVAVWRLWAFIAAVAIHTFEVILDLHTSAIEERATQVPTGTSIWYHEQSLLFQFGDVLTWNGLQYVYDPITPANRIVSLASVVNQGFQVRIKAAKLVAGLAAPLSVAELSAFQGYWDAKRFAGSALLITSTAGDDLKTDYFIKYDALILAPDGSLLSNPSIFPVEDAIESYIQNLSFDGVLSLMQMTDAIQAVSGVIDVTLNEAQAKFGLLPYTSINKEYLPDAGYLVLDKPSSLFTYSTISV